MVESVVGLVCNDSIATLSLCLLYADRIWLGIISSSLHQYSRNAMDNQLPKEATTSGGTPDRRSSTVPPIWKLWPEKGLRLADEVPLWQKLRNIDLIG